MKISVIIPTYKPKDYLWECLDSLVAQTFDKQEFEIILVLNGCKDPYHEKIEKYIDLHPDFCWLYIRTDEAGVSNARNLALERASGEYITFIDDDDYISPSYLEELYDIASPDVVSLCYPLSFTDGTADYEQFYVTSDYKEKINNVCNYTKARKYFSGPVYKLIHRQIIGSRRFDRSFVNGEDSIFMFLISDRLQFVKFTSKNAIYYRRVREDGASVRKKTVMNVIINQSRMIWKYIKIFFNHPTSYSFNFFTTRILGAIHGAFEQFGL